MKEMQESEKNQKILEWIHHIYHKRMWVFGSFVGWIAIGLVAYWTASYFKKDPTQPMKEVDQKFQEIITAQTDNESEFFNILESKAHLKPTYQGRVIQYFLNHGFYDKVWLFGEKICKRTEKELPLFHRFSMGTLLIANGKYQEALELSKNLHKALIPLKDQYTYLHGINALRIAVLAKLTHSSDEEQMKNAVEDVLLSKQKSTSKRDALFVQNFHDLFKVTAKKN